MPLPTPPPVNTDFSKNTPWCDWLVEGGGVESVGGVGGGVRGLSYFQLSCQMFSSGPG